MTDYSKTMIYKIACKDATIMDFYIGHSTDVHQREISHKQSTNPNHCKSHYKLYKCIRENGGWENWTMTILDHYPQCETFIEATAREQEWISKLNPSLNVNEAMTTPEEKRILANAWKRQSESHHAYNAEYNKNLTTEQQAQRMLKQRERYASQTREQKDARNAMLKEKRDKAKSIEPARSASLTKTFMDA